MAKKFNVVQKEWRIAKAERRRALHGDPKTRKLKNKPDLHSISGKRQRKLLKKWRMDQKHAIQTGLAAMESAEISVSDDGKMKPLHIHVRVKKGRKLKVKIRQRGKSKKGVSAAAAAEPEEATEMCRDDDAMME